jgi:predicted  nucleic acid-binding Zn-ribbon protein
MITSASDPVLTKDLIAVQRDLASHLIDARSELESLQLETKRAQEDLDVVEQRIAKDQQRLAALSSAKDAQGVQHELETLARRKSELEDAQLALLELVEQADVKCREAQSAKAYADSALNTKLTSIESELMKLRSGLDLSTAKREQQASRLSSDLLEFYEKKAKRGVAVARLLGRECGACHMTIGATALAEIATLASDDLATCSECQAVLVR